MLKLVLAALCAAVATASYEYTWAPFEDNENPYFDFEFGVQADAYYTTTYDAIDSQESYGFELGSYVDVVIYVEWFQWYMHEYTIHMVPFAVTPYNQTVEWDRPISGEGTHVSVFGDRDLQILNMEVEHIENMKTCGASFVDAIVSQASLAPSCKYTTQGQSVYKDLEWHYDTGALFDIGEWYGEGNYFGAQLF